MNNVLYKLNGKTPFFIVRNQFSIYFDVVTQEYELRMSNLVIQVPLGKLNINSRSISLLYNEDHQWDFFISQFQAVYFWISYTNKYHISNKKVPKNGPYKDDTIVAYELPSKTYSKLLFWLYEHKVDEAGELDRREYCVPNHFAPTIPSFITVNNNGDIYIRESKYNMFEMVTKIVPSSQVTVLTTSKMTYVYSNVVNESKRMKDANFTFINRNNVNYFRYIKYKSEMLKNKNNG